MNNKYNHVSGIAARNLRDRGNQARAEAERINKPSINRDNTNRGDRDKSKDPSTNKGQPHVMHDTQK